MKVLKSIFNIKVLSVIFAIGLWYYVSVTQGPLISKTFGSVPVVPINVSQESCVTNDLPTISVVAEGPNNLIIGLRDSDFVATVDLSNKREGEFTVPVEVRAPSSTIKIISYSPESIKISLDTIATRKFPVVSEFVNAPSTQSQFFPSVPVISPSSITASGPSAELAKIKRVYIAIDLSKVSASTTLTLPVTYETVDGSTLKNVYFNPSTVVVSVNFSKETSILTVPIVPTIVNIPPEGFAIKSITVNPTVITLSAPLDALKGITTVSTDSIDVSKMTKKTDVTVKLTKINGVSMPFDSCKVTIDVEPLVQKTFSVPVEVVVTQGKQYTVSQSTVNVNILGFKEVVDTIAVDGIKAIVDASSLDVGSFTLPINISGLPQNIILQSVVPSFLEVKIY